MANALTLPSDNPLAQMATNETPEVPDSLAYVGFFSEKAAKALDIQTALGRLANGDPYVQLSDGTYKKVTAVGLIGPSLRYWCKLDQDFRISEATTSDPGRGSGLKEHVLLPMLAYTSDGVYPTMTTLRTSKTKILQDLAKGVKGATDDSLKGGGPIAKQLVKLPQALRVVGTIETMQKPCASGYTCYVGRANARLLSDTELEFLANALVDQTFNEECAKVQTVYTKRSDMIKAVEAGAGDE